MVPAFCCAPLSASFTLTPSSRFPRRAVARRPRFTASDSSLSSSTSPTQPPFSSPPSLPSISSEPSSRSIKALHPFISSLYESFSSANVTCMEQHLQPKVCWNSPLFDASSAHRVLDTLDDFLSFAVDPTIAVYQIQQNPSETTLTFAWTLSFNYPLPWRPRVSVSAQSTVIFTEPSKKATQITDTWYTSPFTLIAQALPKLTDILWLFPSAHVETDRGQRKVLRNTSSFSIIYQAPLEEYRIVGPLQSFEHELGWALPALPASAFEGELKNFEQYSAVSPIALRLVRGDQPEKDGSLLFEWALPVPTTLTGSSAVLAKLPNAPFAQIVNVPRRMMAVSRFAGLSTKTEVKKRLNSLLDALIKESIIPGEKESFQYGGRNVWVRCYDCKVGFNRSGVLSMAMYGGSRVVRRVNEIALDITDFVSEERVCGLK